MTDKEKLQEYALIAEILSGIAIVASLIFVGFQLQQNTKSSQVLAYQTRSSEVSNALVTRSLSDDLSALIVKLRNEGPNSLNEIEFDRLQAWYQGNISRAQAQYYQYQQGYLDRSSVDGMIRNMAARYPYWVQLELVDLIEIPELREEIESYIANQVNP